MHSRIVFGAELRYAMQVRALSLTELARRSGVAVATASSAARGRPVNVTTALRIARAVGDRPVIPELLEWVEPPQEAVARTFDRERVSSQSAPEPGRTDVRKSGIRGGAAERSGQRPKGQLQLAVK